MTRGGYYAWCKRGRSLRARQDEQLLDQVRQVRQQSRGCYGSPRVMSELRAQGCTVGRRPVASLQRRSEIGYRSFFASVPNALQDMTLCTPDPAWIGDVTYLRVAGQWRCLAAVMDRHSRRLVGWSVGRRRDAALTRAALGHAMRKRQPAPGLVFHSDRGMEYAAYDYRADLARLGIRQSMNRPGKMNDNAHMESFFHSMKTESLYGVAFEIDQQLRNALGSDIRFYNQQRRHSSLNYVSPSACERKQGGCMCQLGRRRFRL